MTALYAAVELQYELETAFFGTGIDARSLPNIVEAYDPRDMRRFLEAIDQHQKMLLDLINDNGVMVTEFENIDELRCYFQGLGASAKAT